MAGIIKNQILKHLSRFVKNLSSDRINLSTLKGEGELNNLELEEDVLTELLALPTWMQLTQARCNRVLIRIPWTKLKSVPIHLSLDEVYINVEACEELRHGPTNSSIPATSSGKYGFVNKVIDGITATVNSVEITFSSKAFESKVQISRIRVESRSPDWQRADLQGTRLKEMNKGETLIFKEMEWQTLRLESRSTSDRHLAPLRLLTNQAKARIVIKKKLSDCQVVGCRLSLILDDLLWVLTDSQILAALHFINSLSSLVKQATELTQRVKAARKLETLPEYQAQLSQTHAMQRDGREDLMLKKFDAHDVKETSYHFICEKIDLHFCDDPGKGRSQHPDLKDGGALQLSLSQVMFDFYPYHLARGTRKYWSKYTDNTLSQWLYQALQGFRISLIETLSSNSLHSPLHRTQNQGQQPQSPGSGPENNPVRERVTEQLAKLMSTCLVFKVQDLRLYRVTTSSKREAPQPFISTFIERPKDLPVIHAEFSSFYYPGDICFPLPSPKIYAHFHPIQIRLDLCTVLWLNSFVANLQHAMEDVNPKTEADYVDVRVELIMPKLVLENKTAYPSQKDRPQSLHLQVSRMVLSNYRSTDTGTLHQLTQCLDLLQSGDLAYGADFPSKVNDTPLVAQKFLHHAEGRDKIRSIKEVKCSSFKEMAANLTKDMLWSEPRDVWYICLDPFWAEFHVELKRKRFPSESNSTASKKAPNTFSRNNTGDNTKTITVYPFIDSIPMTVWVYVNEGSNTSQKQKSVHAVFSANGICKAQLTHNEFLFLMRMAEAMGELSLYLTIDLEKIMGGRALSDLVTFLGFLATVEVSLLYPPPLTGKQESPSMDLDSIIPDSSSRETELENPEIPRAGSKGLPNSHSSIMAASVSTPHLTSAPVSMSSSPLSVNVGGGSNPMLSDAMRNSLIQSGKGLPSLAVSFSKCGGASTPDSEVVSNWSNFSSEDSSENNFVQLDVVDPEISSMGDSLAHINMKENGSFQDDEAVEVATEVIEENDLTERSTPSPIYSHENALLKAEKDDSIGVFTVRLEGIEVAQEGKGLLSLIKMQCRGINLKECTGMGWNEFQTKFGTRYRTWAEEAQNTSLGSPTQRRALKVRLAQKIDLERFKTTINSDELQQTMKSIRTPTNTRINLTDRPGPESPMRKTVNEATVIFLDGRVDLRNEEPFVLHMSTVMELTAFFEDEIIPSPFPMQIELIGLNLELIEDRPSPNISSPGPVPLNISIPDTLPITRDKHGVFLIGYRGYKTPQVEKLEAIVDNKRIVSNGETGKSDVDILQEDLEKVLRQLDMVQKRNTKMEEELESSQDLKLMVLQLQDQVSKLQEEKMSLLTLLRRYQS